MDEVDNVNDPGYMLGEVNITGENPYQGLIVKKQLKPTKSTNLAKAGLSATDIYKLTGINLEESSS